MLEEGQVNSMSQNETKIQKQVQAYIRSIGGYCFKVHGSIYMRAGIPDVICCIDGKFVGIETKDGDNTASELQLAHGRLINKAGGLFMVAYSVSDVEEALKSANII